MILHVEYPTLAVTVFPPKDTLRGVPHISCCCFPAKRYSTWSTTHQLLLFPRQKILHVESHASCYFSRQNLHHVEGHVSCYFFPPKLHHVEDYFRCYIFTHQKLPPRGGIPHVFFRFLVKSLNMLCHWRPKMAPGELLSTKVPFFNFTLQDSTRDVFLE
jgi:hypothetical protein